MVWVACVLEGNGQMALVLSMCPKYCISLCEEMAFAELHGEFCTS